MFDEGVKMPRWRLTEKQCTFDANRGKACDASENEDGLGPHCLARVTVTTPRDSCSIAEIASGYSVLLQQLVHALTRHARLLGGVRHVAVMVA